MRIFRVQKLDRLSKIRLKNHPIPLEVGRKMTIEELLEKLDEANGKCVEIVSKMNDLKDEIYELENLLESLSKITDNLEKTEENK